MTGFKVHRPLRTLSLALAALFVLAAALAHSAPPPAQSAPPPVRQADVCVYAATPSGVLAAVAVAREGRSVILVEPSRWVGGILGAGIKPGQDCPNKDAVGGLAKDVILNAGKTPASVRAYFERFIEQYHIPVIFEHRLAAVDKDGSRIVRLRLENAPPDALGVPTPDARPGPGLTVAAKVFIDASYEGDVLAKAGVTYATGREPAEKYNESFAGVRAFTNLTPIDPFVRPGDPASGLLPLLEADHGKPVGAGDDYTQAYNFRFYVTTDTAKRAPFTRPADYDPSQYELVGRYVQYLTSAKNSKPTLDKIFPGWLNSGEYNYYRESLVTIAPLGVSRLYQDGDYATRSRVWRQHIDYLNGLHYFLSTDPRVPQAWRDKVAALGLDRTHHPDTNGWPYQLYVRIARRMMGRYVLTQSDVLNKTAVEDPVGLALFGVDTYPVRRVAVKDPKTGRWAVATEGNMFIGGNGGTGVPFGVPYRAITPQEKECANLLVPVCFSASYIAYAAARMEPVFMILGESAGLAATQALAEQTAVQNISQARLHERLLQAGQVITWNKPPTKK